MADKYKAYTGTKAGAGVGGQTIEVKTLSITGRDIGNVQTRELQIGESFRIAKHSPTGFNWGYPGSGPAQLALAILLDVTGDKKLAQGLYQEFKRDIIAAFGDHLCLTEMEVKAWIVYKTKKGGDKAAA